MQPQYEVAHVLQRTDIENLPFTGHQKKVLRAIRDCRTALLGGHIDACDECGNISISYNSCRDRHCPKCQGHKRQAWISKREADLLPCTYFHVVFTLPDQLNPLALHNPRVVYAALFDAAWQTLQQFASTAGVQAGMIAILHTCLPRALSRGGQNLSLHPHLHCIVPGAGVDGQGRWQKLPHSNNFLFPVKALSKVFRAKYVASLRNSGIADKTLFNELFSTNWVVHAKRPFGGPQSVIEYLGRYTHKVAISNHRLTSVTDSHVSFTYKDYRAGGKVKTMQLTHAEFTRRFAQHILPHRFVRIRHYGILSSSWKRGKLQALQQMLRVLPVVVPVKTILRRCPCCKTGTLITIEIFGKRGPPKTPLTGTPNAPVA